MRLFLSFSPNKEINPKKKKSFYFVCDKYLSAHFRIFVGTWNVAGRSPVGSLAVDLDEWLNLKDAADMYVLGYVIIVRVILMSLYMYISLSL